MRELIAKLRSIALQHNMRCLGCGYEHSCNLHGCAIINETITALGTVSNALSTAQLQVQELTDLNRQHREITHSVFLSASYERN